MFCRQIFHNGSVKMKKQILYILCLNIVFITGGCVDENLTPNSGNIEIHLCDEKAIQGISTGFVEHMSIEAYPIAIQDRFGVFHLSTSNFPYNLRVLQYNYYFNNYIVFNQISKQNVFIVNPSYYRSLQTNLCYFFIRHPKVSIDKRYLLKFISPDIFTDLYSSFRYDTITNSFYGIKLPINTNSISGKILFFEITYDSIHKVITSFDKYGEKNISVNTGSTLDFNFNEEDIKYNPEESNVTCNIIYPERVLGSNTKILLSFDGFNLSSDLLLYIDDWETLYRSYNIQVPSSLPTRFRIKLYNSCAFVNDWQERWVYGAPGSSMSLDNSFQPILFSPANRSSVTDTTIFTYGADQKEGIYYLNINGQIFVTKNNQTTLKELKVNGFTFPNKKRCSWWVTFFSGFNSIDEFVSQPYLLNPKYTSRSVSEHRLFTAP